MGAGLVVGAQHARLVVPATLADAEVRTRRDEPALCRDGEAIAAGVNGGGDGAVEVGDLSVVGRGLGQRVGEHGEERGRGDGVQVAEPAAVVGVVVGVIQGVLLTRAAGHWGPVGRHNVGQMGGGGARHDGQVLRLEGPGLDALEVAVHGDMNKRPE